MKKTLLAALAVAISTPLAGCGLRECSEIRTALADELGVEASVSTLYEGRGREVKVTILGMARPMDRKDVRPAVERIFRAHSELPVSHLRLSAIVERGQRFGLSYSNSIEL